MSYCQNLDPLFFTLSNLVYSNRGSLIEELSFSIWSTFLVSCIFCWTGLIGWKCPTSNWVWEKYKSFIGSQSKGIESFGSKTHLSNSEPIQVQIGFIKHIIVLNPNLNPFWGQSDPIGPVILPWGPILLGWTRKWGPTFGLNPKNLVVFGHTN